MEVRTRRRRTRADAEREILDAAAELLAERSFEDVTVSEVMARTTLTRKSFYVYFADRYVLLARLVEPLRRGGDDVMARLGDDDPRAAVRDVIRGIALVYAEHGVVLRALAQAAGRHPEARTLWEAFTEPVIARIAATIRGELRAGAIAPGLDPDATARVLVGMNLFAFFDRLAGRPDADVDAVVDALHPVWDRALYGP